MGDLEIETKKMRLAKIFIVLLHSVKLGIKK